jgi:hypothetical protein
LIVKELTQKEAAAGRPFFVVEMNLGNDLGDLPDGTIATGEGPVLVSQTGKT